MDKLAISQLGFLAQRRLARGVKLNHSEATVSLVVLLSCSPVVGLQILIPIAGIDCQQSPRGQTILPTSEAQLTFLFAKVNPRW